MTTYEVRWLGDPPYGGRDEWPEAADADNPTLVDCPTAVEAVPLAIAQWALQDIPTADDPLPYGEGTVIGVREVVAPPPVRLAVALECGMHADLVAAYVNGSGEDLSGAQRLRGLLACASDARSRVCAARQASTLTNHYPRIGATL